MHLLKAIYEKIHNKPAPYYYNYSLKMVFFKPIRKWLTNTVAANCPFNCIRIVIYRMCGFKIGKGQEHLPITVDDGAYIGMRASIISKNVKSQGGYISAPMQRLGRAHWLIRTFQKVQRLFEYHVELSILQTVQV